MPVDIQGIALKIAYYLDSLAVDFVPYDTGELRKSHKVMAFGTTDALVSFNTPYAAAVHNGRRAMVIKPVKAPRLVWKGPNGKKRGAAYVHQPARPGNPWMKRAVEALERDGLGFLEPDLGKDVADDLMAALRKQGLTVTSR